MEEKNSLYISRAVIYVFAEIPGVGGGGRRACAPQVLGYQLSLFGSRGVDYAGHITTGSPIFLDDAESLLI